MSICTQIGAAIMAHKMTSCDKRVCDGYEAAATEFEQLVKMGVTSKRGYQLLPVENKSRDNIEVNHSRNG